MCDFFVDCGVPQNENGDGLDKRAGIVVMVIV